MLNFINKKFLGKTFADVCCGIGGGRLVLESLGAKCVYAFESDKYASVMYKENFGEEEYLNPSDKIFQFFTIFSSYLFAGSKKVLTFALAFGKEHTSNLHETQDDP